MAVGARYYVELRIGRLVSEQAKTEISKLQTELGQRKVEIGDLQARTSARRLTDAQRETMARVLAKATGASAVVVCKLLDGESCDYADQIAQVLRAANWIVEPINKTSLADLPGVIAVYRPFQQSPRGAQVMQEALVAAGVSHQIGMLDEESTNRFGGYKVYIVVGRKA
jgi:hypothetical protein